MAKRGQYPEWWLEKPELEMGDEMYLNIWKEASSARPASFSGISPIPIDKLIYTLEVFSEFIPKQHETFFFWVIRTIDSEFIKFIREKEKKKEENKKNKPMKRR